MGEDPLLAALARIFIPPHMSVTKDGKPYAVKAHFRTIKDAPKPPPAPKAARPATSKVSKSSSAWPGLTGAEVRRAQRVDKLVREGTSTQDLYATKNEAGVAIYTPERQEQQRQLLEDMWARFTSVPSDGKAILSGGLGGSGKTTVLTRNSGIDQTQYVVLNPDDIKEEMVRRGMAPKVPGLKPRETAGLMHEESSMLTKALAARAYAAKKNVIWDLTMSDRDKASQRALELREHGYSVRAVYVDVPIHVAIGRALQRWLNGDRKDPRNGGRYVSPHLIRAAQTATGNQNRDNFRALADSGAFDQWEMWDNSGTEARRMEAS